MASRGSELICSIFAEVKLQRVHWLGRCFPQSASVVAVERYADGEDWSARKLTSEKPAVAGIGTAEAIRLVWSAHREIIMDVGPVPPPGTVLATT